MKRMAATPRRWTRRRTITISDIAVWAFVFLLTAAGLLALCIILTIAWPKS
jgi:hypothetical protein